MTKTTSALQVKQDIKDFLATNLLYSVDGFPYGDDASLLREGIIDSLAVVELVEFVQKRFSIKVDQQDVVPENFDSVSKIAAYVSRKAVGTQA
jgi:acyl carrier protein